MEAERGAEADEGAEADGGAEAEGGGDQGPVDSGDSPHSSARAGGEPGSKPSGVMGGNMWSILLLDSFPI